VKILFALLIGLAFSSALRAEEARLSLEPLHPAASLALGDTLEVGVYIEAGNLELTSASVYLSFDPAVFALVPALELSAGRTQPFASADFMAATVYENAVSTTDRAQLSYVAVSGVGAGGDRAVGRGRGLLASVRFRSVGYPPQGIAKVWLEAAGQRQPSYTVLDDPGVERRFYVPAEPLYQQVEAEGLIGLPDLRVAAGEAVEIDLEAHFLSAVWSAADLRWQASFRAESGALIAIEGTKLRLVATEDGIVDYRVETPDGRRWGGEFAVQVAQKERYLHGDTIYMVEDGVVFRRALSAYLKTPERVGQWSVRGGTRVVAALEAGQLAVAVPADWAGQDEIELHFCVEADDCETLALAVEVAAQNDAPSVQAPPAQDLVVGQRVAWPLRTIFADIDDALEDLVIAPQSGRVAALYRQGEQLVVEALAVGEETLLLRVEDPQGFAAEAAWLLRVSAPSAGPNFLAQPSLVLALGEPYRLDLGRYIEDADTPLEDLQWTLRAEGVELSRIGDESSMWFVRGAQLGETTVYLTVRDPEGNEAAAAWIVEVAVGATDSVDAGVVQVDTVAARSDTLASAPSDEQNVDPPSGQPAPTGDADWSIAPLGSVQMRSGQRLSVSLQDYIIGSGADSLIWSVDAVAGIAVEWAGSLASLRAADSFSGRALLLFHAVDGAGRQRSAVLEVQVVDDQQLMVLGDIPDLELAAETTQHIELSNYADRAVVWSVSGGEGLEVRIVEDVAILRARAGFYGRSILLFRAVDADGNAAVDVVRVEVRAGDGAANGESATPAAADSSAISAEKDTTEPAPAANDRSAIAVLELGVWSDYVVEIGSIGITPTLDELVVAGDAAAVQWSLRGGVFVEGAIDAARRIVLDARSARVGREVFLLRAELGGQQREIALGVEVRAPVFSLRQPAAAVPIDQNGYELAQLLRGSAEGIEWQVSCAAAIVRLEAGRLFVAAAPGVYEVLVTGRSAAGGQEQIALQIRVEAAELVEVPPVGTAPDTTSFSPQLAMPEQVELAAGASGRWPLQVVDEDSAWDELVFSLVAAQGWAHIEGSELVLQAGTEDFSVYVRVRDAQGNESAGRVDVRVYAADQKPPEIELRGELAAAGHVLWTLRADEVLGEALLLVDGQPLPIQQRASRSATWLQVPTGGQQIVRVVAADSSGNTAQKQLEMSAGQVGDGSVLQSADGKLRALGGALPTPVLLYAEGEIYRLDFALGSRVEIALLSDRANWGLFYGDGVAWREIGASLSVDRRLLRAVISEPGFLRAAEGQQLAVAAAAVLAYPNPFNATTAIRIYMPTAGFLRATVYDMLGRRTRVLADGVRDAGAWTLRWHGRDEQGAEVASGVYFVEIEGPGWRERVRMLLLR
jgi:hypothetical protein